MVGSPVSQLFGAGGDRAKQQSHGSNGRHGCIEQGSGRGPPEVPKYNVFKVVGIVIN